MKYFRYGIAAFFAIILFFLFNSSTLITKYLWFLHHGQTGSFWVLFLSRFTVHLIFMVLYLVLFFINFAVLRVFIKSGRFFTLSFMKNLNFIPVTHRKWLYVVFVAIIVFIAFVIGGTASQSWKEALLYINQVPFENAPLDPVFSKGLSFYFFSLPFLKFLHLWTAGVMVTIIIFSVFFHIVNGGIIIKNGFPSLSSFAQKHLSVLASIFLFLIAIGYWLASYSILFSQRGKFFGAGYTAVHSQLFAYKICFVLSLIAAVFMLLSFIIKNYRITLGVLVTVFFAYFLLGTLLPSFQQRFMVEPNELEMEGPYIGQNIAFTRQAYGLDKIESKTFQNDGELSWESISANTETIENIRLWDWQPLKQTFRQLQELKPYYNFIDVDIDRYEIDGRLRAVNLAARELVNSKLSQNSQTWINNHLVYTHGYGLVMNRVDRISPEGLPEMIVKDIPPKSEFMDLERPEIYYGETDNDFVITNSRIQPGEFDYPSGEKNSYTTYEGDGGIKLDSLFKRLVYAIAFSDINILISNNITTDSRIHYKRNITEMVSTIAPYLLMDQDPYIVATEKGLYYMIDCYTLSQHYPYSSPIMIGHKRVNYIRNSVKVVVDAYNGNITFYTSDKNDALIKVYSKIFKNLYKPLTDMPKELAAHIRYPETLLDVQSAVLKRYHMTDINVFYNNEDAWELPRQIYDSAEETMDSYYIVTNLPGEKSSEFVLMLPFTPIQKDNMISFLVAKCDAEEYGKLLLYRLPKEKLSYGPMQIEARINQDPEISKQLTLWSQKGSRVIRGNMLAIPVNNSLLFVEPLYLKAETSEMPELKRVVVAFKDKIVMEENLNIALAKAFETTIDYTATEQSKTSAKANVTNQNLSAAGLIEKAYTIYNEADAALKQGDLTGYSIKIKELGPLLEKLNSTK